MCALSCPITLLFACFLFYVHIKHKMKYIYIKKKCIKTMNECLILACVIGSYF